MGKSQRAGKSHSYPLHCKPCLTCRKGLVVRNKLKINISMEKNTSLFDKRKKIQTNSN